MADRKASDDREKSKDAGNAVCRFIRRLSPTKKYHGSPVAAAGSSFSTPGASSSRKQETSAKDSSPKKSNSFEELKKSLNLESKSSSSSKSSLSSLSMPSPWATPTQSNQSLNKPSEEYEVLRQLHSNFGDNTKLLGEYISLRDQKK